jgi:hypothetical protein
VQDILMKTLVHFPNIDTLKQRMQSLAVLDALLCPEWEHRYFSYNKNWGVGETMGSIRNGSGDEVFALFSDAGCFIKEFYHERPVLDEAYAHVPVEFLEATQEKAFSPENVTACYWRGRQSSHWEMNGNDKKFDPITSFLLATVDGKPEIYEAFAKEYYGQVLPSDLTAQIFQHETLTPSNVDSIAFAGELEELKTDIDEIGYPSSLP